MKMLLLRVNGSDQVSGFDFALVRVDKAFVELVKKCHAALKEAAKKIGEKDFCSLHFGEYHPTFLSFSAIEDILPDIEDPCEACTDGPLIVEVDEKELEKAEHERVSYCELVVHSDGDILWQAGPKHCDGSVETGIIPLALLKESWSK